MKNLFNKISDPNDEKMPLTMKNSKKKQATSFGN